MNSDSIVNYFADVIEGKFFIVDIDEIEGTDESSTPCERE